MAEKTKEDFVMLDKLTNEQIECLNGWPAQCLGHAQDRLVIQHMNELCAKYGYGRIGQLGQALEEIWRNPEEGGKKWQDFYDERMELLKDVVEKINEKGQV